MKIWAPSMITALIFLQPSSTAFFTAPTAYIGWLPMLNECLSLSSDGVTGQHAPNQVMSDAAITGTIDSAKKVNDPTTETTPSSTAWRAHVAATAASNCSSQTITSSGWPAMPPRLLMYSAYALAVLAMFSYVGPAAFKVVTVITLSGVPVGVAAEPPAGVDAEPPAVVAAPAVVAVDAELAAVVLLLLSSLPQAATPSAATTSSANAQRC